MRNPFKSHNEMRHDAGTRLLPVGKPLLNFSFRFAKNVLKIKLFWLGRSLVFVRSRAEGIS